MKSLIEENPVKMVSVIQEMIGILLLGIISMSASANEYTCTIKSTLKINQNGYFVKHGWAANYMNRQFTVEIGRAHV